MTADELRPPIPASLAHRPVRGGIAQAWVNSRLGDGGTDFRSPHTARYEQAWTHCLCQSCGKSTGSRAVLVCGPRQVLELAFDEPPTCPPCAGYARAACPFVSGRATVYADRRKLTEGPRGAKCFDPSCDCGGWSVTDPEHSADMGGQPNLPWYAVWVPRNVAALRNSWVLTAHVADISDQCAVPGCRRKHERTLINGALLTRLPLKVQLMSVPGEHVERRTLTTAEALEHAQAAIDNSGVKPAGRSPMWDGKPFALPEEAVRIP